MIAEFICNLPKPIPAPDARAWLADMHPACVPREFYDIDPSWERVGDNLIGPAVGENNREVSYGLYHCPQEVKEC